MDVLKFIGIVIMLVIFPLITFLEDFMAEKENILVIELQDKFPEDKNQSLVGLLSLICKINGEINNLFLLLFLYMLTDTLIVFRSFVLYTVGNSIFGMIKLIYMANRPFWVKSTVVIYNGQCHFDYSMPAIDIFNTLFLWMYLATEFYRNGYYSNGVKYVLYVFIIIFTGAHIFAKYLFGLVYLYHQFITILLTIAYLTLTLVWENEILKWCEDIGFDYVKSR